MSGDRKAISAAWSGEGQRPTGEERREPSRVVETFPVLVVVVVALV